MRLRLHAPNRTLWIIAAVLFVWSLLPLPFSSVALILSAALMLLGTWLI